jgi:hypothetical protein
MSGQSMARRAQQYDSLKKVIETAKVGKGGSDRKSTNKKKNKKKMGKKKKLEGEGASHPRCGSCSSLLRTHRLWCNCREVAYCDPACQLNHWRVHKRECKVRQNQSQREAGVSVSAEDATQCRDGKDQ